MTGGSTAALLWPLVEKKGTEYLGSRQQSGNNDSMCDGCMAVMLMR